MSFKPQHSRFIKNNDNLSKKEEILYTNTLPSVNHHFNQNRTDLVPMPGCVVQSAMHNCENLQPFVNYYQLSQNQEKLNDEWNDINMEKRYKNLQKERDQDSELRNFNPVPSFDMIPINTSCAKDVGDYLYLPIIK